MFSKNPLASFSVNQRIFVRADRSMAFSSVSIFLIAVALWHGCMSAAQSCKQEPIEQCCTCRDQVASVSLHVINVLKDPLVNSTVKLHNSHQLYLLGFMQQATQTSTDWRFSATYYSQKLGFYLDTYHGVTANYTQDKSYWNILGGDGKSIPLGISSYVPAPGEMVTFNLTNQ
ncbi:hypothetical protein ACOMHN_051836 [Nucella lapillus]